jgi:hypothetical protein
MNFVTVYYGGQWLMNADSGEISVDLQKTEIKRAGTRSIGNKIVGFKGTGHLTGLTYSPFKQ